MVHFDKTLPPETQGRQIHEEEILISHSEHMAAHGMLNFLPRYRVADEPLTDVEFQDIIIDFGSKLAMLLALTNVRLDALLKHYERLAS